MTIKSSKGNKTLGYVLAGAYFVLTSIPMAILSYKSSQVQQIGWDMMNVNDLFLVWTIFGGAIGAAAVGIIVAVWYEKHFEFENTYGVCLVTVLGMFSLNESGQTPLLIGLAAVAFPIVFLIVYIRDCREL